MVEMHPDGMASAGAEQIGPGVPVRNGTGGPRGRVPSPRFPPPLPPLSPLFQSGLAPRPVCIVTTNSAPFNIGIVASPAEVTFVPDNSPPRRCLCRLSYKGVAFGRVQVLDLLQRTNSCTNMCVHNERLALLFCADFGAGQIARDSSTKSACRPMGGSPSQGDQASR